MTATMTDVCPQCLGTGRGIAHRGRHGVWYRTDCHVCHGTGGRTPENPARSMASLSDEGVLWAINKTLFHPRGFALAIILDGDGEVLGWEIQGDGTEPWTMGPDVPEDDLFAAFEALLNQHRRRDEPEHVGSS